MDRRCPIFMTMDFLGKKWTLLTIMEIYKGKEKWKRYSRIKENLPGITPKMLSMRLKELETEKIIRKRVDASSFPVKSEYALTERGIELLDIAREVKQWGLRWKVNNPACAGTECRECEF